MFTGIIEEVGSVASIVRQRKGRRVTVASSRLVKELKKGDSIAVSGVCLTAVEIAQKSFSADLAQETWERTSFSRIQENSQVNLELPLRSDGRFGGHIVQGHVDGVGKLISLDQIPGGDDYWLTIEVPADLSRYVVAKGSICIEGISLTVAKLEGDRVSAAIIPHTVQITNLRLLKPGDPVNLEVDMVAKYVEKMMGFQVTTRKKITLRSLVKQGF